MTDSKQVVIGMALGLAAVASAMHIRRRRLVVCQFPDPGTNFRFTMATNHRKTAIIIPITTGFFQKIRVKVWDAENPKTCFTDRYMAFHGDKSFEIMLPVTPKTAMVTIYAEADTRPFSVGMIHYAPLKQRLDVINLLSPEVRSFIDFAQDFSYNASYLPPAEYRSDDKKFFIEFLPKITGSGGSELSTPARINTETGTIQVSKKRFDLYTVPMRMAVLLHEFSHVHVNDDVDNETEADLNGLLIYLGLGYPRVEAFEAWTNVFSASRSPQNSERFKIIEKFIADFEDNKIVF